MSASTHAAAPHLAALESGPGARRGRRHGLASGPASGLAAAGDEATPLWHEPAPRRAPLERDVDADVAIVGAGYTGLWTAYYLLKADPTLRVVVIERKFAGYGASGRNGGWASAIFPLALPHVARASSQAAAIALQRAMNDTVDEIGAVTAAEGIDARYAKQGFVSLARSTAQEARARATAAASADFGLPGQWQALCAAEAAALVGATDVKGGVFTQHCALVHPGRLVRGLADTVERLGARIAEGTTVLAIEPGRVRTAATPTARTSTPGATVRAPIVVRATEGFTPQFREHRRSLVPLYSLVIATEPVPQELRRDLRLDHRIGFNDLRHLRIYAQVSDDGRMIFGGRGAPYHFGSRVRPDFDTDPRRHAAIHRTMLELFPALAGVAVTHRWGGPLGVPRDWHPSVGLDRATGMAWAGPYVGDGVTTSNLAGRVLRNLILERPDELDALPIVNHRSPAWEPEPLRWLGVNAGLRAASAADVQERITGRPSTIAHVMERLTGAH